MAVPKEHQVYLQQSDFAPDCPAVFSVEERAILARYGRWMEALASGAIAPATPAQQHCIRAARGEAVPATRFEQIWVKVGRYRNSIVPAGAVTRGCHRDQINGRQADHDELLDKLRQLGEAKRTLDAIRESMEAAKKEILKSVEADLAEINARYSGQLEEASRIVSEIEAKVKSEVLRGGLQRPGGGGSGNLLSPTGHLGFQGASSLRRDQPRS